MLARTPSLAPLLLLVAVLAACRAGLPADRPGSTDTAGTPAPPAPSQDFPDTEIGRLLAQHMLVFSGVGMDAEEKYQGSLASLRARAPEAASLLVRSYAGIEQARYFRRWAVLETLRELADPSSLELAVRVAESPLPDERFRDDAERSSMDEERRISIKAVEVVSALAAKGAPAAEAALLRLVKHEELGMRRTAIRGYLAAGGAQAQSRRHEELRRLVAPADASLLTLETTDIRKVPHPDVPGRFELGRGKPSGGPPPAVKR